MRQINLYFHFGLFYLSVMEEIETEKKNCENEKNITKKQLKTERNIGIHSYKCNKNSRLE